MESFKFRIDYIIFGGLGLFLLLSLLTSDFNDPTVFNQLYPSLGIQNWTGLIGALIGGSLLEVFGPSTFILPWFFVRVALHHPRKFSVLTSCYYVIVIVFLLSIFYEIALNLGIIKISYKDFFWQNGYAGRLGLVWLEESINLNFGVLLLSSMLIFSITRMLHIISPIPFIKGLIDVFRAILSFLFKKIRLSNSSGNQSNEKLPNFEKQKNLSGKDPI